MASWFVLRIETLLSVLVAVALQKIDTRFISATRLGVPSPMSTCGVSPREPRVEEARANIVASSTPFLRSEKKLSSKEEII